MMSCEKDKDNDVLQTALESASTSDQAGFRITYDIYYSGRTAIEHSYYAYSYNHPFYVHYTQTVDSDMSQMLVKRNDTYYVINEVNDQYYQSNGPVFLEENTSIDIFDLLEDATLVSSSVYETYETKIEASQLELSLRMIQSFSSYLAMYQLEKSENDVEDFLIDVVIKVRKKGEIHSIVFDFSKYLNEAYQLDYGRTFERARIEYYYLPSPFTPNFNDASEYIVDDHSDHIEHNPFEVSLNSTFSMNLQYMFDIDIVTLEVIERKEIIFTVSDTSNHIGLYNIDNAPVAFLSGAKSITLDPGVYYIIAIGIDDLEVISVTISS